MGVKLNIFDANSVLGPAPRISKLPSKKMTISNSSSNLMVVAKKQAIDDI